MRAKEYWVIMCSYIHIVDDDWFSTNLDDGVTLHKDKNKALHELAELTAQFPNTVYTLYHLVPTEHTTHKR